MRTETERDFISIAVFYDSLKEIHSHRDVEILYLLEGSMNVTIDDSTSVMEKEDVILVNSGKKHGLFKSLRSREKPLILCVKISYGFLCDNMDGRLPLFWCNSKQDAETVKYKELKDVLRRMAKDHAVNKGKKRLIQYSDYYLLLHLLTNYFVVTQVNADSMPKESRLDEIRYFIEENYSADISLTDLAENMNLSVSYLSRYFKKSFGINFINYIYNVRLEKAKEQLMQSTDSITDIAYNNGFPNVSAFNRYFREKYQDSPSNFRKEHTTADRITAEFRSTGRAYEVLEDYLAIADVPERQAETDESRDITADLSSFRNYVPTWNVGMNLGPAESILDAGVQTSILYAKEYMGFDMGRLWGIFEPNMYIAGSDIRGAGRFYRLDKILYFLLKNKITPVIELSEKPIRIEKNIKEYLKEPDNKSAFSSYEDFLQIMEELMRHLVEIYSVQKVNEWKFEIWDDRRVEVYRDKKEYIQIYTDVRNLIRKYAPEAKVGGAGNYLGWNKDHTESVLRMWIDHGVYPDYMTFTYSPYYMGETRSEKLSKRKSDEDDLKRTLENLNKSMLEKGFPPMKVFITSWNMTNSSRNYFNDSLWKACYIIKCCIESLGKVDGLLYSQLQDSVTDYYDNQQLLNGSGGLLTRDWIAKPAFLAYRLLRHLQKYFVASGDNYIITRDDYGKITIVMHNFIARNYLYYLKEENENTLKDHYSYFVNQNTKNLHFELEGVEECISYELHHHVVNRKSGSIMDEWAKYEFNDNLHIDDIDYLKAITMPSIYTTKASPKEGKLIFDVLLEPLEVRCISLRPMLYT